jgi:ATP-dependent DNA helicase RecG
MRETNDGFRIAEEDLRLRGPARYWVSARAAKPSFRLPRPNSAGAAPMATQDARLLLERDGGPEGRPRRGGAAVPYLFERDQAVDLLRVG